MRFFSRTSVPTIKEVNLYNQVYLILQKCVTNFSYTMSAEDQRMLSEYLIIQVNKWLESVRGKFYMNKSTHLFHYFATFEDDTHLDQIILARSELDARLQAIKGVRGEIQTDNIGNSFNPIDKNKLVRLTWATLPESDESKVDTMSPTYFTDNFDLQTDWFVKHFSDNRFRKLLNIRVPIEFLIMITPMYYISNPVINFTHGRTD